MKEVGYIFYVYIVDFIKLWLVLWGMMNFPPVKKKSVYIIAGVLHVIILFVAGLNYKNYPDIVMFFWTFMVIAAVCFLFMGKYFKVFTYSLLAYVLSLLLDACTYGITNFFGHELLNESILRFICNIINIFIIAIIVFLKRRLRKSKVQVHISKRIYALLFAGAGTGTLILTALLIRSNDAVTDNARRAMIIVIIIVVISYCAACLMMIIITESRDNYKALSLINQSVIESQQKYYILVNDKQQEIHSIRHEMKNHLACINGLYKSNKLPEMEEYIKQLIDTADASAELFDTGNDIVNAILNDAQSKYRKDRIRIRLEGGFPAELKIAPMDLCVIFANMVTNAVEAILLMERNKEDISYIDVKIRNYKDDLYIDMSNPVGKNVITQNGKYLTTKKDKNLHGFGVENIKQRVEKYQGTANFTNENNLFYVDIFMKNK